MRITIYDLQSNEMSFEIKLAWRYFRSRRKYLVRFTSLIAVIGIAAGVASLIAANAISKGFSDEMKSKVLNNTSHITIYNESETVISDWQIIARNVEKIENVENFQPTSYESAVISSDANSSYGILRVSGVRSSEFRIQNSNKLEIFVSIGKELAEKLELKIGDEAKIITLEDENTPINSNVFVGDIFETGLYEYDATWIFVDKVNYLRLKKSDKFTPKVFSVAVKNIYEADKTADLIRKNLGGDFKVLDWQEANKPLFAALSLERKVAAVIILLIILLAVLNITTTLSLLVNERKADIAILRACGAKMKSIVAVFLFEGIILSLTGIFAGMILGLAICFSGNYFKIISLSKQVYSLEYIPFNVDFISVLTIAAAAFLLSLTAVSYPAFKSSKIKPLENLRN